MVVDESGYPHVVQRDLTAPDAAAERRVDLPVAGAVRHIAYSADSRWLACEVAPDGGERGHVWLVTSDPDDESAHRLDRLADLTAHIVCWDGTTLALTAIDGTGMAEGRLVTPGSDDMRVIDRRLGGQLAHVRDGVALFRVGSRGQRELLHIRPDGRWAPLLPPDPGSTTDMGVIVDSGVTSGQMRALVCSDHQSARMRLLEVTTGHSTQRVRELAARSDADLDTFAVSLDTTTAALLWNHDGCSQLQIIDLSGETPRDLAAPQLPPAVVTSPSLTADGSLLTFCVEGPEFPPRVVLWDVAAGQWSGQPAGAAPPPDDPEPIIGAPGPLAQQGTISASTPSASPSASTSAAGQPGDERQLSVLTDAEQPSFVPELIRYPARDGLELTAWVYRAGDGPRPTWVYFHGGPEGQSRPSYNNVLRQAVDAGFTVVAPNVRGSSGQGRAFSHADERYARFSGLDDVADTVAYLVESGISDADRMVVGGRSYGGYLTLATLVRHPQLWRGGIAACGMSDLETFYRDTEAWVAIAAYPKYGHPVAERELLRELSPIHHLSSVKVPVLFVHGGHDTNVPVSESRQAIDVLRNAGTWCDLLLFDDEGHEFLKRANRHQLGDRVESFLKEVLS